MNETELQKGYRMKNDTEDSNQLSESLGFIRDNKLRKWVQRTYMKEHPKNSDEPFESPEAFIEYIILQKATEHIPLCNSEAEESAERMRWRQCLEIERQKEQDLIDLQKMWSNDQGNMNIYR